MAGGRTLAQLNGFLNTTLPKMRRGPNAFVESQKFTRAALVDEFIHTGSGNGSYTGTLNGTEYQERVRLNSNTGSTRGVDLYETTSAIKGPTAQIEKVPIVFKENKGIVGDLREQALNSGAEQIVSWYAVEESAANEDVTNHFEYDISRSLQTSGSTKELHGLPMWLRGSMSSAGAFVANTAGSFDGKYWVYRDGTVGGGTLANIDASTVINERWRNYNRTRITSTLTKDDARAIREMIELTNFKPYPMMKGKLETGDCAIFMDQADHGIYSDMVGDGNDDKNGDLFPFRNVTIKGTRIVRTPSLDGAAITQGQLPKAIYGVRLSCFSFLKMPGWWMKRGQAVHREESHNAFYIPIDFACNLMTNSPRTAGFVFHGSW